MKYLFFINLLFLTSLYAQLDEQISRLEQDEVVEQQTIYEYQKYKNIQDTHKQIEPEIVTQDEQNLKDNIKKEIKKDQQKYSSQNVEQNNSFVKKRKMTQLQRDFARQQMLRKARFLRKRYKEALAKLDNWESKKEALIQSFQKKYAKQDTAFGDGNSYGERRARKRREKFYRSLEIEEQHIIERATAAEEKLRQLEEDFIFQFAVTLEEAESSGVKTPTIKDKEQKVQMIQEYLNENRAWKKCWEKVREFEKLQNVASSIEKLFPESQLTESYISDKKQQNEEEMQEHIQRYENIDQEYKEKYGLALKNDARARAILEKLNSQ
jgi:hypothetical protein